MSVLTRKRILVVDDSELSLRVIRTWLEGEGCTDIVTTSNSADALRLCRTLEPDVLLLDLNMPDPDGLAVLAALSAAGIDLPVVVVTGDGEKPETRRRVLGAGASDILAKPFDGTELVLRLRNVLGAHLQLQELQRLVAIRTADLEQARLELLSRLALAGEFRDDETHQHTQRVGRTAFLLATRVAPEQADLIRHAAPLHDIGKVGIPDAILMKPGSLTDEEYATMKGHTEIGRRILAHSSAPILQVAEEIAHTHHERWDGRGYPRGLSGHRIPLVGRITAVADTFDAMTHNRPYRAARPIAEALGEIRSQAGGQFDPEIVAAFGSLDHEQLLADVTSTARPIGEPRVPSRYRDDVSERRLA